MYTLEPRKDSEQQCYKCGETHKYAGANKIELYLVNKLIKTGKDATDDKRRGMHILVYAPQCTNCESHGFNVLMASIFIGIIIAFMAAVIIKSEIGIGFGFIAGLAYYYLRPKFGGRSGKISSHPVIRELYRYGFREIKDARCAEPRYYSTQKIGEIFKKIVDKYDYILADYGYNDSTGTINRTESVIKMAAWKMGDVAQDIDLDLDFDMDMDLDDDFDADFDFDFDGGDD